MRLVYVYDERLFMAALLLSMACLHGIQSMGADIRGHAPVEERLRGEARASP